eukprot:367482-Pleurochrysis_carterae.AAC.1
MGNGALQESFFSGRSISAVALLACAWQHDPLLLPRESATAAQQAVAKLLGSHAVEPPRVRSWLIQVGLRTAAFTDFGMRNS